MAQGQPPLNYEASLHSTHPHISATLPTEVVLCLKNARFLHLATCSDQVPHVSLMNYTYLPATPYTASPSIIMTTNPASRKTLNLQTNPRVSLLVHDWVSHRPPTRPTEARDGSPPARPPRSSLADMLFNMNTSALSRISATINGAARIVESGSEEERWCKQMHLDNNTFGDGQQASSDLLGTSPGTAGGDNVGDGGRGCFIEGEEVRVVVVDIKDGRIADWKGGIRDWQISAETDMLNGV